MGGEGETMSVSRIFAAVAVVGLLAASGAVAAGTTKTKQDGKVNGDSKASVRLVVISKAGAPKSVKNLRLRNLKADCTTGKARIKLRLSGAAKVNERRKFANTYRSGTGTVDLSGKVKRDSSRVHATIGHATLQVPGFGACDLPKTEFTTRR
jgi:hypothetical protein